MTSKSQAWLYAFRLRTLPLAFSSIITGSSLAFADVKSGFNWLVFALLIITTLLLQILSNLANDYGDSEKGTDNDDRIGPKRAVQAGLLSFAEIKSGIFICVTLCLIAGSALVYEGTKELNFNYGIFFFMLGIAAIAAAIKYTVGKNAYGYQGLGDFFVLLFFGLVGVCGSYYLLAHRLNYYVLLPGLTIGTFATGVLNLNNMRDFEGDAKAGKITMVGRLGLANARKYQLALIVSGYIFCTAFVILTFTSTVQFAYLITFPLFRKHLYSVRRVDDPKDFDPLLKQLAISTFIFSIVFAIGIIVASRT